MDNRMKISPVVVRSGFDERLFALYDVSTGLGDFAHWAFSGDGLPNLRILAYGDFAHDDRFKDTQVLLCRNLAESSRRSFRFIQDSDVDLHTLLAANMELLRACPVSAFLVN